MADVLTGKGYLVTTSLAAGLTASASETITIIGCQVSNVHSTTASWLTAHINRSGGVDTELCHELSIPVNDAFNPVQNKIVLNPSDALEFQAENASSLEATISYLVQT